MAEFKNDDLLLVNRADESYKVPGEALYATYLDKPEIGNLSLVESNPGVDPRFTDQSFVATTTMTEEGQPLSEKTYDAYVEGAILADTQFNEPLESSTKTSITSPTYSNSLTSATGAFRAGYENTKAFDGRGNTYAAASPDFTKLTFDATSFNIYGTSISIVTANAAGQAQIDTNGANRVYSDGYGVPSVVTFPYPTLLSKIEITYVGSNNNTATLMSVTVDGVELIDDTTTSHNELTFANGTDMSLLEVGDLVTQPSQLVEISSRVWSDSLSSNVGVSASFPKSSAFDGNDTTYAETGAAGEWTWDTSGFPLNGIISVRAMNYGTVISVTVTHSGGTTTIPQVIAGTGPQWFESSSALTGITSIEVDTDGAASQLFGIKLNGTYFINNQTYSQKPSDAIKSITGTSVILLTAEDVWADNEDVTGPTKTIQVDGIKKYLEFTGTGQVTGLLDAPQSPPYVTTDEDPVLTLTFPSTFPSGFTPDEELGEGVQL